MKFSNLTAWEEGLENNQDPYGAAIYAYAERWAELMEIMMDEGGELEDIADRASHEADVEGITGFMYGAAVHVLSNTWYYGEGLRKWHNLDVQIGDEGEKANESGATLNPAVMSFG